MAQRGGMQSPTSPVGAFSWGDVIRRIVCDDRALDRRRTATAAGVDTRLDGSEPA
jgi:hypothetical protein